MQPILKIIFFVVFFSFPLVEAHEKWAPDFLIIGAQKSGTTVLRAFLNQHPKVINSNHNEVHFFDEFFTNGVQWYKKQFPKRPDKSYILGDKSPYYLFFPLAPERAHALYPDLRIIILLRNPVDRAYSQYWHNRRSTPIKEKLLFQEAIEAEPKRLAGEEEKILADPDYISYNHRNYSYLARGIYIDQIKRWLDYFPKEQVMIIPSSDLRNNTLEVVNDIFRFLGISKLPELQPIDTNYQYPPMDPELRKKLSDYFRPFNKELEEYLGREFNWD